MLVTDIPTATFNQIIEDLRGSGWKTISEYAGMDAWIDYGKVVLRLGSVKLTFEWDNWFEGNIDGPDVVVKELQERYALT